MSERRLAPLFTWRSAICESELASTHRHVAIGLSLYMSERGDSAHPGAARLARDCALHVATVRRILGELVEAGWLEVLEHGGRAGDRRRTNVYRARLPEAGAQCGPIDPVPDAGDDPSSWATRRAERDDPSSSIALPVVEGDPISTGSPTDLKGVGEQARRPRSAQADPIVDTIVAELLDGYRADYGVTHAGAAPPAEFSGKLRAAVRRELRAGADRADLRVALGICAEENRTALAHVLADVHSHRAGASS